MVVGEDVQGIAHIVGQDPLARPQLLDPWREVRVLHDHYHKLVELAKKDIDLKQSHSIEDAEADHERKLKTQARLDEPEA